MIDSDLDLVEHLKSAVGPMPEPPPDRLAAIRARAGQERRRRWTEAIGTTAMSVAIIGGLVAVTGAGVAAPERPRGVFAAAAAKAEAARTMRFEFTVTEPWAYARDDFTGLQPMEMRMTGDVDLRRRALRMTTSMPGSPRGDILVLDDTMYVQIDSALAPRRPDGAGDRIWVRTEVPPNDLFEPPDRMLLELEKQADGDPVEVGREVVRGVPTTRYRIDRLKPSDGEGDTAVADVWIDDDGLPRRVVLDGTFERDGTERRYRATAEYYDYGAEIPPITAPPDSEVIDKDEVRKGD